VLNPLAKRILGTLSMLAWFVLMAQMGALWLLVAGGLYARCGTWLTWLDPFVALVCVGRVK